MRAGLNAEIAPFAESDDVVEWVGLINRAYVAHLGEGLRFRGTHPSAADTLDRLRSDIGPVRRVARALLAALGALLAMAGCAQAQSSGGESFSPLGVPRELRIVGVEFTDPSFDGRVRYYVRSPAAPAQRGVVFIGGSGCGAAFPSDGISAKAGPELVALKESPDVLVAVIDKPGVPRQFAGGGTSEGCPQAFLDAYDFDIRLRYVQLALQHLTHAHRLTDVQVIGSSEGALLAAAAAASVPLVSMVTLISGFSDLDIAHTLDTRSNDALLGSLHAWQRILQAPADTRDLVFGHPHKRWASWSGRSSAAYLLQAPRSTKVLLVQGLQDSAHPPESFASGLAALIAARREFLLHVVDCGDHMLVCQSDAGEPKNLFAAVRIALAIHAGKDLPAGVQRFSFALP